jgi:hypothetical protein
MGGIFDVYSLSYLSAKMEGALEVACLERVYLRGYWTWGVISQSRSIISQRHFYNVLSILHCIHHLRPFIHHY